ncbi:hypothetical protein LTR37_012358 [Vermiconidia calcicola]|uniref:Uncharacterized protein n=1 Tax=Vermiconidia calcicola TaxID=1690605 RepID=A0ACC3N000_9PEZI|nr:hypothetical protein LTR37_012358 [Vermiconidia calcicola]
MPNMPYCPRVQFGSQLPTLESIYKPLGQDGFRLLQLLGYDDYGILRCSLQHARFQDDTTLPYSAISYTWSEAGKIWYGDYDTSQKPIRINGAVVLVSHKVANIGCLAQQTDTNEKSSQVARMGAVYGCAAEVLSFLASPSRETDEVFDQAIRNSHMPNYKPSPSLFASYLNLFANEYWQRAWVFQEIAMARTITIHCGSRTAALDTVFALESCLDGMIIDEGFSGKINGLRLLRHSKPMFSRMWKHGMTAWTDPTTYATKGINSPFLDVLRISRGHKACRDPRDMLYSRMALASDAATMIPYPDYEMSVDDLYKRFATNHIIRTSSLDIITFANHTAMHLPTWVPDWTSQDMPWDSVTNKHDTLRCSLSLLAWSDVRLPRISRCRSELMVQGRVLKIIQRHDIEALFESAFGTLARYSGSYPLSEVPRMGDSICVLRGCSLPVYLRAIGQHVIVVGRHFFAQDRLFDPKLGLITAAEAKDDTKQKNWSLTFIEAVQSRREEIFRIR